MDQHRQRPAVLDSDVDLGDCARHQKIFFSADGFCGDGPLRPGDRCVRHMDRQLVYRGLNP